MTKATICKNTLGHCATVYKTHFKKGAFLDCLTVEHGTVSEQPLGCPETSVRNYQHTLRKISKGRRIHLQLGRSLKSRTFYLCLLQKHEGFPLM